MLSIMGSILEMSDLKLLWNSYLRRAWFTNNLK